MRKHTLLLPDVISSMLFASSISASAKYIDTSGHWGETAIVRWSEYGIIEGDDNGKFNPDNFMTRAEAATVFVRLLGLTNEVDISNFTDVNSNDWYKSAISKCVAAGILSGIDDSTMNPNGTLTREQMFVMFGRALGIKENQNANSPATDHSEISSWATGYINAMMNSGFIAGVGNGEIKPLSNINRASVMSLINQTIKTYANTPGSVAASDTGITLIVADNVMVTGNADTIILAGANNNITIEATASNVNIVGDRATVKVTGTVNNVNISADNVTLDGSGKVKTAIVTGQNADIKTEGTITTVVDKTPTLPSNPSITPGGGGGGSGGSTGGSGNNSGGTFEPDLSADDALIADMKILKTEINLEYIKGNDKTRPIYKEIYNCISQIITDSETNLITEQFIERNYTTISENLYNSFVELDIENQKVIKDVLINLILKRDSNLWGYYQKLVPDELYDKILELL